MTDRELMQMALDTLESKGRSFRDIEAIKALRDRLAQPEYEFECPRCGHCCQQHEWVGLTYEEVKKIVDLNTDVDYGYDIWCNGRAVARDVEAKLKEKNNG
jgi:hypothetical protein